MEPIIDFTAEGVQLPEGVPAEALNTPAVQDFIKGQFDAHFQTRFDTESQGLRRTNEQLKQEKKEFSEKLNQYEKVDFDEIDRLRELAKNNGEAVKQLEVMQSQLTAKDEQVNAQKQEFENSYNELQNAYHSLELKTFGNDGIAEFNAEFATVALKPGNERWIHEEAAKVWRRNENGDYVPMNGDRLMTDTATGNVMTYAGWMNSLRSKPGFTDMFLQPSGGGAGGGGTPSAPGHFNPKDLAGGSKERGAAIASRFPNLPAR